MNKTVKKELLNSVLIILGILCAGMGLKGFLFSSNFIDGGVTGVSQLMAKVTSIPLSVWLPLVNVPFIVLGYRSMGMAFAIRSLLAIAGLSVALVFIPYPDVTPDLVLTAVFGCFFIGAGIGLAVRGGAVLDGTEIAALLISQRNSLFKVGDVILGFNIVIFLVALAILGVEPALYSMLTYFTAAKTLDFVLYGLEEFTGVIIISSRSAEIREKITHDLGRGVTILKGKGSYYHEEQEVLYSVVTRLEIGKVKDICMEFDQNAFITVHSLVDVIGGTVKRRAH